MNRYFSLILGALLLLLPSVSVAQSGLEKVATAQELTVEVVPTVAEITQVFSYGSQLWGGFDKEQPKLATIFYQGLNYVAQGDSIAATKTFANLRASLDRKGYSNAPEFSFELLGLAAQMLEQGKTVEAQTQVNFALSLSPKHPRVFFATAGFYDLIGLKAAFGHIVEAIALAPKYPLVCITLLLNAVIVAGFSLSLALLFVSVVQLLRGGEHLVKEVGKLFPRTIAGLAGAIILPLCLVAPLFLGLLAALAVWSMLLSLYRPSCKYYAFVVSAVILLWAWLIPNARVIGLQTQMPNMQAVEDINAGNYNSEGEESLLKLASQENSSSAVILGAALVAQNREDTARAGEMYAKLRKDLLLPTSLQQLVSLNRAVIFYKEKKFLRAKTITDGLEKQGLESFELFHNSALISIELFETEKYRHYYDRARAIDESREDLLQLSTVGKVAPAITMKLSFFDFWYLVNSRAIPSKKDSALAAAVTQSLLKGGTPQILELLAGVTLCVGVFGVVGGMRQSRRRRKSTVFVSNLSRRDGSILWCILPAGYAIAGKYPITGAMYLAVVIASIVLAFGAPMNLLQSLRLK